MSRPIRRYSQKSIKITALFLGLLIISSLFAGCSNGQSTGAKENSSTQANLLNASTPISEDDFLLKGVRLGDLTESFVGKLGQPQKKSQQKDGLSYDYGDIEVIIGNQNSVVNILTDQAAVMTRRGIHPGSTLADVKAAYGDGFIKTEINGLELYEYTFAPMPNNAKVLRFAIKSGTGIVNYIGCRLLAGVETTAKQDDMNDEWISRALNSTYISEYNNGTPFTLTNGQSNLNKYTKINLNTNVKPVVGQLNARKYIAFLLRENGGGTATWSVLAVAAIDDNGTVTGLNAVTLADRIQPQEIRFENNMIFVDYLGKKSGEAYGNKNTVQYTATFLVEGNKVLVQRPILGG